MEGLNQAVTDLSSNVGRLVNGYTTLKSWNIEAEKTLQEQETQLQQHATIFQEKAQQLTQANQTLKQQHAQLQEQLRLKKVEMAQQLTKFQETEARWNTEKVNLEKEYNLLRDKYLTSGSLIGKRSFNDPQGNDEIENNTSEQLHEKNTLKAKRQKIDPAVQQSNLGLKDQQMNYDQQHLEPQNQQHQFVQPQQYQDSSQNNFQQQYIQGASYPPQNQQMEYFKPQRQKELLEALVDMLKGQESLIIDESRPPAFREKQLPEHLIELMNKYFENNKDKNNINLQEKIKIFEFQKQALEKIIEQRKKSLHYNNIDTYLKDNARFYNEKSLLNAKHSYAENRKQYFINELQKMIAQLDQ